MQEHHFNEEETWDAIAESFDTTRRMAWQPCLDFIKTLKGLDVVVDLGCGNGRHLLPAAKACQYIIGVDVSRKLLDIVNKKIHGKNICNATLLHSDAVLLPLETNSVDALLCIASLHNIKGSKRRQFAIKEIVRVLKPNGTALISVWSRWQKKYYRYFLKQFFFRSQEFGDIDIYWRQHKLNIPRFYHLYSRAEFIHYLKEAHLSIDVFFSKKIHSKYLADNFFAVVRKR